MRDTHDDPGHAVPQRDMLPLSPEAFASLVAAEVLHGLAGVPRGYLDKGAYIWVRWQQGVVGRDGPNGAQVDDVLALAMRRLGDFQGGAFACIENRVALRLLGLALDALRARTRHRVAQGVEATETRHETPPEWQGVADGLLEALSRVTLSGLALPGGGRQ
ncbi:MAG: hypothetical protein HY403_01765 [Elusimicrobia bacterium]|nr:hypothetical protein [Elusimicrobiota bacterium]